jgi:LacI family transcriptional regulator
MFCSSDEKAENAKQQIEMLQQGQVDGFIISPPEGSEEQIRTLAKSKTPYVLVDRYFADIESNYVVVDNSQAAYEGTVHLIKKGYRKIACVTTNANLINMNQRLEGYKQALIDAKIPLLQERIKVLQFTHERDDVFLAIKQLLFEVEDKIEAILFTTSKIGVGKHSFSGLEYSW